MNKYGIPGTAVAVEPHLFSYGVASKNTRKPVTANSLFELESISKTITSSSRLFGSKNGNDEVPLIVLVLVIVLVLDRAACHRRVRPPITWRGAALARIPPPSPHLS
jgi:hypothetical protein